MDGTTTWQFACKLPSSSLVIVVPRPAYHRPRIRPRSLRHLVRLCQHVLWFDRYRLGHHHRRRETSHGQAVRRVSPPSRANPTMMASCFADVFAGGLIGSVVPSLTASSSPCTPSGTSSRPRLVTSVVSPGVSSSTRESHHITNSPGCTTPTSSSSLSALDTPVSNYCPRSSSPT